MANKQLLMSLPKPANEMTDAELDAFAKAFVAELRKASNVPPDGFAATEPEAAPPSE